MDYIIEDFLNNVNKFIVLKVHKSRYDETIGEYFLIQDANNRECSIKVDCEVFRKLHKDFNLTLRELPEPFEDENGFWNELIIFKGELK